MSKARLKVTVLERARVFLSLAFGSAAGITVTVLIPTSPHFGLTLLDVFELGAALFTGLQVANLVDFLFVSATDRLHARLHAAAEATETDHPKPVPATD